MDAGLLEAGYADFGNTLAALADALRELDGQLTTSLSEWSGPARQAYDAARAEWWRSAAELAGTLAWLRGVLSVARVNYGRCEDSVIRAFTEG